MPGQRELADRAVQSGRPDGGRRPPQGL